MRIGLVVPTRGDRPKFLKLAIEQIKRQTFQPAQVEIVNYPPKNNITDLRERVKKGYDKLKYVEYVAIWEDDDYYSPDYLHFLVNQIKKLGYPKIIGQDKTIYYHIGLKKYVILEHPGRSSLFKTAIQTGLKIDWGQMDCPFLDLHLWEQFQGGLFFKKGLAVGIKHGIGKCGGRGHFMKSIYTHTDSNWQYLRKIVGKELVEKYKLINANIH